MSWITFKDAGESVSGKTRIWTVDVADPDIITISLGEVKWFGRWRKYAFFPKAETVFEQCCLREIAEFCERQTRERKQ